MFDQGESDNPLCKVNCWPAYPQSQYFRESFKQVVFFSVDLFQQLTQNIA